MTYFLLFLICIIFIELFIILNLREQVSKLMGLSKEAMSIIRSKSLDEEQKEKQIRKKALETFMLTVLSTLKFLLIFLALFVFQRVVFIVSPTVGQTIMEKIVSVETIVLLTFFSIFYVWIRNVISQGL